MYQIVTRVCDAIQVNLRNQIDLGAVPFGVIVEIPGLTESATRWQRVSISPGYVGPSKQCLAFFMDMTSHQIQAFAPGCYGKLLG